jgi:hypothetical protein
LFGRASEHPKLAGSAGSSINDFVQNGNQTAADSDSDEKPDKPESYYYDDAYGYEDFDPDVEMDESDSEDDDVSKG